MLHEEQLQWLIEYGTSADYVKVRKVICIVMDGVREGEGRYFVFGLLGDLYLEQCLNIAGRLVVIGNYFTWL